MQHTQYTLLNFNDSLNKATNKIENKLDIYSKNCLTIFKTIQAYNFMKQTYKCIMT